MEKNRTKTSLNIALVTIAALKNPKEATRITTLGIAKELIRKGHTVTIITPYKKGLARKETVGKITILRGRKQPIFSKLFSPLGVIKSLRKRGRQFDIIQTISATPLFSLVGIISRIVYSMKTVHTFKAYSRKKGGNLGYFLLTFVHKVTIPSHLYLRKLRSLPKRKISILPSPVRLNSFFPRDKRRLRKKHGFPEKKGKIVFYYGSMHQEKGADVLIRAIPLVLELRKDVCFIFAPRYKEIGPEKMLVERLGVEKWVHFLTDDIAVEEYVALADMVVLPYRSLRGTEATPSCLLEAMASKTLVVTSNLREIRGVFHDSALYTKPNDPKSLSWVINHGLSVDTKSMRKRGCQLVQGFGFDTVTENLEKLYFNLLRR